MKRVLPAMVLALTVGTMGVVSCAPSWMKRLQTNDVDRARANHAAGDSWLRLTQVGAANYMDGSNQTLSRYVGSRTGTLNPKNPAVALNNEINQARSDGWTVFGIECEPVSAAPQAEYQKFRIGLQNRSTGLDEAVVAVLGGQRLRPGLETGEPLSSAQEYRILAYVPHHADRGWPKYAAIPTAVQDSCIGNVDAPSQVGVAIPSGHNLDDIAKSMPLNEQGRPQELTK